MRTRAHAATMAHAASADFEYENGENGDNGHDVGYFGARDRTFSIGHVAHMLNVSTQTLRYYEREGLVISTRTSSSAFAI